MLNCRLLNACRERAGQDADSCSTAALQGCVFTQDINQAIYISDAMETGTVQVNAAPARGPDVSPQGFQGAFRCSTTSVPSDQLQGVHDIMCTIRSQ